MSDELKSEYSQGIEYKYGAGWTKRLESEQHWRFYWYQQKIMEDFVKPDKKEEILEIGVGSGFTANYCKSRGLKVTTMDIDADKKPDIIANAVSYPFTEKYDHLMAFEVFEHMPYNEFEKILFKIPSFINRYTFISLPRNEKVLLSFHIKLPKLKPIALEWRVLKGKISTETHQWELDYKKEYSQTKVEQLFSAAGLKIKKMLKCEYIRFYALEIVNRKR